MLLLATSGAPTISPGVGASVETVLPAKWNGEKVAGKGIAIRQSVKYQTLVGKVWHANAMMASRARSRGMATMEQAHALRHRATSRIPLPSRA